MFVVLEEFWPLDYISGEVLKDAFESFIYYGIGFYGIRGL